MKAIYTFLDDNGQEVKKEIKGVVLASKNKDVIYPNGKFYPSFTIESRIEDLIVEIDIIPGSKLVFEYE